MATKRNYLKFRNETMLKDALYHLAPDSGSTSEYNRGIILGVVSTLMATGLEFKQAIDVVACYMPNKMGTRLDCPPSWSTDLRAALLARGQHFGPSSADVSAPPEQYTGGTE